MQKWIFLVVALLAPSFVLAQDNSNAPANTPAASAPSDNGNQPSKADNRKERREKRKEMKKERRAKHKAAKAAEGNNNNAPAQAPANPQ